ncbi:MAG: AAA family ATPase [Candidatus Saccharimonadales bacterium]
MTNLIILRGPSASDKTTVAKLLKQAMENNVALLDFDVFRGDFLDKKGEYYPAAAKMLMGTATIALESGYDVIIDGFYRSEDYPDLLSDLLEKHPESNFIYYFDVSLETTIHRHSNREKSNQFGEKELRQWYYKPKASAIYDNEYKISETLSATETVDFIKDKIVS